MIDVYVQRFGGTWRCYVDPHCTRSPLILMWVEMQSWKPKFYKISDGTSYKEAYLSGLFKPFKKNWHGKSLLKYLIWHHFYFFYSLRDNMTLVDKKCKTVIHCKAQQKYCSWLCAILFGIEGTDLVMIIPWDAVIKIKKILWKQGQSLKI